jgi:hypothetical protein
MTHVSEVVFLNIYLGTRQGMTKYDRCLRGGIFEHFCGPAANDRCLRYLWIRKKVCQHMTDVSEVVFLNIYLWTRKGMPTYDRYLRGSIFEHLLVDQKKGMPTYDRCLRGGIFEHLLGGQTRYDKI